MYSPKTDPVTGNILCNRPAETSAKDDPQVHVNREPHHTILDGQWSCAWRDRRPNKRQRQYHDTAEHSRYHIVLHEHPGLGWGLYAKAPSLTAISESI
jgi:hypothetical protein